MFSRLSASYSFDELSAEGDLRYCTGFQQYCTSEFDAKLTPIRTTTVLVRLP